MKPIGIIGAMEEEVARLKEHMEQVQVRGKAGMSFVSGLLKGREAVVVRSGIGKVNAGLCTQILADDFQVEAILNTGVAGSLRNEINIGDIVLSTDALQHDVDVCQFGYALGQIPRMDTLAFPADRALLDAAEETCRRVNPDIAVYRGRVLSGDQFISSDEIKQRLIREFQGSCTEMEGAAIAQGAYLNGIPFLIIRAISDKADHSAVADNVSFEQDAIAHCVRLTEELMAAL